MDIHKPHAPHSWGEFAREIATIVTGILIALALEQGVNWVRDGNLADEARASVRSEIASNLALLAVRRENQICVDRRLAELGPLLRASAGGTPVPHPLWISRPTYLPMLTQNMDAARAGGRLSLLPPNEQRSFASYAVQFSTITEMEQREQFAWAKLRGLEDWDGPLDPAARIAFVEALQDARFTTYRLRANWMNLFYQAGRDHIAPAPNSSVHSSAICLPIGTSRAQALRLRVSPFGDPE